MLVNPNKPVHAHKPAASPYSNGGASHARIYPPTPMQMLWSGEAYLEAIERRLGRRLHENARKLAMWPFALTKATDDSD